MRYVLSAVTRRDAAERPHRRHSGLTTNDSLGTGPAVPALARDHDTTAGHREGDCQVDRVQDVRRTMNVMACVTSRAGTQKAGIQYAGPMKAAAS
jgi:hypothetical protein